MYIIGLLILAAIVSAWSGYWYRRHEQADASARESDADALARGLYHADYGSSASVFPLRGADERSSRGAS